MDLAGLGGVAIENTGFAEKPLCRSDLFHFMLRCNVCVFIDKYDYLA